MTTEQPVADFSSHVIEFFQAYSRKNALKCLEVLASYEDNFYEFASDMLYFLRLGIYNRQAFAQSRVHACGLRASTDLLEACLSSQLEVSLLRCVANRCIDAPAEVEREFYKEKRSEKESEQLKRGAELVGSQADRVITLSEALNTVLTSRPLDLCVEPRR